MAKKKISRKREDGLAKEIKDGSGVLYDKGRQRSKKVERVLSMAAKLEFSDDWEKARHAR